jgi:hypothetical protein
MTDEELITMVREQRTSVPMTIPVEQIISRGDTVRARRRIPGIAGALAAAAAAAIAVAALLPAGHQANRQPPIQLAAWTVVKHADGTVVVTVRQLRDPAGLQRTLRRTECRPPSPSPVRSRAPAVTTRSTPRCCTGSSASISRPW